jgi:hypothetical protein
LMAWHEQQREDLPSEAARLGRNQTTPASQTRGMRRPARLFESTATFPMSGVSEQPVPELPGMSLASTRAVLEQLKCFDAPIVPNASRSPLRSTGWIDNYF